MASGQTQALKGVDKTYPPIFSRGFLSGNYNDSYFKKSNIFLILLRVHFATLGKLKF